MSTKKLEIVMLPIDSIIPYWRNPRINDATANALVDAIKAFGFNVPLVVDKQNVVVKGHARLKAARMLGMEAVPCIRTDATDKQNKLDRIADNKIQELSQWDNVKLEQEMVVLENTPFITLFKPIEEKELRVVADNEAESTLKVKALCPYCGEEIYVN